MASISEASNKFSKREKWWKKLSKKLSSTKNTRWWTGLDNLRQKLAEQIQTKGLLSMTRRGVDSLMGVHPHGLLDIGQLFGSGVARFSRQKQWCSMFHLFIWPMSSPNSWGEVLRLLSAQNSVQFVLLKWIFPIIFAVTLPPIIIHDHGSVENRVLEDVLLVSKWAIFIYFPYFPLPWWEEGYQMMLSHTTVATPGRLQDMVHWGHWDGNLRNPVLLFEEDRCQRLFNYKCVANRYYTLWLASDFTIHDNFWV